MVSGGIGTGNLIGIGPATKTPWLAILMCIVINMFDGFDVSAISFTAPAIAKAWGIEPVALGVLGSSGLVGMAAGAMLLSPLADLYGRRFILLSCLFIISIAMLGTATAHDLNELILWRIATGVGVGGLLAGANTATAEYAPPHRRDIAIALITSSYPIGAVVGGFIAKDFIEQFGWQSVFTFGGLASTIFTPFAFFLLPESVGFLIEKRPRNALARLNKSLKQLNRAPVDRLPDIPPREKPGSLADVFSPQLIGGTIAISLAFFFMMLTLYFALFWVPKNMTDWGLTMSAGISVAVIVNVSGIVGGVLFGLFSGVVGIKRVAVISMVLSFFAMLGFGLAPAEVNAMSLAAAAFGFVIFGAFVSMYAIVAAVFPTHVRTTGTGLALGVGRIGAIIGPILGGYLIAAGLDRSVYYAALGVPCLLGAVFATWAARRIARAA